MTFGSKKRHRGYIVNMEGLNTKKKIKKIHLQFLEFLHKGPDVKNFYKKWFCMWLSLDVNENLKIFHIQYKFWLF